MPLHPRAPSGEALYMLHVRFVKDAPINARPTDMGHPWGHERAELQEYRDLHDADTMGQRFNQVDGQRDIH